MRRITTLCMLALALLAARPAPASTPRVFVASDRGMVTCLRDTRFTSYPVFRGCIIALEQEGELLVGFYESGWYKPGIETVVPLTAFTSEGGAIHLDAELPEIGRVSLRAVPDSWKPYTWGGSPRQQFVLRSDAAGSVIGGGLTVEGTLGDIPVAHLSDTKISALWVAPVSGYVSAG